MSLNALFIFAAVFGGAMFLVRTVASFTGVGGDTGDVDAQDIDLATSAEMHEIDGADSQAAFKLWSIQSLVAFIMMFGLGGLTARSFNWNSENSTLLGIIFGLNGAVVSSFMMYFLQRLNSVPTRPMPVVGDTGKSYTPIPMGNMPGIALINNNGRLEEYHATSTTQLKSFTALKVIEVRDDKVLVVEPLNLEN